MHFDHKSGVFIHGDAPALSPKPGKPSPKVLTMKRTVDTAHIADFRKRAAATAQKMQNK